MTSGVSWTEFKSQHPETVPVTQEIFFNSVHEILGKLLLCVLISLLKKGVEGGLYFTGLLWELNENICKVLITSVWHSVLKKKSWPFTITRTLLILLAY